MTRLLTTTAVLLAICAVTQAQAKTSISGLSASTLTTNGMTVNGVDANGATANAVRSKVHEFTR